jgi:hypothetical protein
MQVSLTSALTGAYVVDGEVGPCHLTEAGWTSPAAERVGEHHTLLPDHIHKKPV